MDIGDIVVVGGTGDPERDLMCAGFRAKVMKIDCGIAFVDSDKAGVQQATSFRGWWPINTLELVEGK